MVTTADQRNANNIKKFIEFVNANQYDEELDDDDPFFFNLKKNRDGEIILGDGSDLDHLNLMVTSKYLLSFLGLY